MKKQHELYRGKAKTVYETDDKNHLIIHFRNDTSAFNGVKIEQLERKGHVNNYFNAFIMQLLAKAGIANHFVERISNDESVVKRLDMLPVECVVRNVAAGSICRRLGIEEGTVLNPPVFEFFLKNDGLNDPMINDNHIRTFNWASDEEIEKMKQITFNVNEVLKPLFSNNGLQLVDYKLEFGRYEGQLLLGDEFTPDGCRIWDTQTNEKLDKDRFRQDLGNVVESYEQVATRLGISLA